MPEKDAGGGRETGTEFIWSGLIYIIIICRLARAIRHLWQGVWPLSNVRGPFPYARIMAANLTSSEIDGKL